MCELGQAWRILKQCLVTHQRYAFKKTGQNRKMALPDRVMSVDGLVTLLVLLVNGVLKNGFERK